MAGLFDVWSDSPSSQADLAMAAGLLAGRGNFGGILGRSIAGGQESYNQAAQLAQQKKLQDLQAQMTQSHLAAAQQQQMDADAVRKFWANQANYMKPAQQAPGDYGPGEAPQTQAGPMSPQGVARQMLASGSPALAQQGFAGLQKSYTPTHLKSGETIGAFDPDTGKFNPAYTAPREAAPTQLADLVAERAKLPPGHPMIKVYDEAITKASTHQPPIVQMGLGSPVAVTGPDGKQMLVQPPTKPGGKAEIVQIGGMPVRPASEAKPLTESQANANVFAKRMIEADKVIGDTSGKYSQPALSARQSVGEGLMGAAANAMLSSNAQKADQAQRDFINATLRRESGAAINAGEFQNGRLQYFPQPGDKPEVIAQKARNRKTAIEGIREGAGPSASVNKSTGVIDFGSLK